jgi:hypothetical protein
MNDEYEMNWKEPVVPFCGRAMNFMFHERLDISWLTERLFASREGLYWALKDTSWSVGAIL